MLFRFSDCLLDTDRRELKRGTRAISVGPQVFDLLVYLLQNRDRVVSKDDVLAAIWHGRTVSESTLTSHINAVRKALGDTGVDQRLIRTIARKGFRFVGIVDQESVNKDAQSAATEERTLPLPDKPSIAVLPFANFSGDPEQEYFADGMVDDILSALSRVRWLFVIARQSSFSYKGRAVGVKQIGRELGVRYVVEGSVRKAGSRVRITAQLIDVETGAHLWAERYERDLSDIFALQDEITMQIAAAVEPNVQAVEIQRARAKPPDSLAAYDLYLRALWAYHGQTEYNTEGEYKRAEVLLGQAIELDPGYAEALGLLTDRIATRTLNGWHESFTRGADGDVIAIEAFAAARVGRREGQAIRSEE